MIQNGKPATIDILGAISRDHRIVWYLKSTHLRASDYSSHMERRSAESYVKSNEWYRQIIKTRMDLQN